MTLAILTFQSPSEFTKYVEQTITETKAALTKYNGDIEEVRRRYEKTKKKPEASKKQLGSQKELHVETKQTDVAGFKVLMNPTPDYELTLMEEVITSLQEKASAFESARGIFPVLGNNATKVSMILNEGIPTGFMLYMQGQ